MELAQFEIINCALYFAQAETLNTIVITIEAGP